MRRLIILQYLLIATFFVFGQNGKAVDSLHVKFFFPYSMVYDSSHLTLNVIYRNNTNRYISIYESLDEGYKGDRFFNISIEMEKLNKNKYSYHPLRFYISAHAGRMEDSFRHYDLPKKQLQPYASDTLTLDILKVANGFSPGKYRFKAHLRVKTIRDDREYNDPNFESEPPMDKIEYTSSQWIYFTVKKEIQRQLNTTDK